MKNKYIENINIIIIDSNNQSNTINLLRFNQINLETKDGLKYKHIPYTMWICCLIKYWSNANICSTFKNKLPYCKCSLLRIKMSEVAP